MHFSQLPTQTFGVRYVMSDWCLLTSFVGARAVFNGSFLCSYFLRSPHSSVRHADGVGRKVKASVGGPTKKHQLH